MKLTSNNMRFGEKSISSYEKGVESLNSDIVKQRKNLDDLGKKHADAVREQGANSRAATTLAIEYNKQTDNLNRLERQLETATKELKTMQEQQRISSSGWGKLGGVLKGVGSNLTNISQSMKNVGQNLTRSITMPAMGAATALSGIALVKGFDRLTGIDNAQAKLKGLGHDAESVETIMSSALEAVKGTAHGMDEAATTAASAVAAGIKPGKELTRYLSLTGDAAAIAGASMSEMGSIINQVQTSQVAYTDNLNQLSDRGIPIYQWLGKEAGVAASEVKNMASEGKISSEMFLNAIEKNIGGAAQKMGAESFTAGISNMWAAVGRLGASFLDAGGKGGGFFSQMKPLIGDLTSNIDSMGDVAERWGVKFGEMFAGLVDKIKSIKASYDELSPTIQNIIKKVAIVGSVIAVAMGPVLTFGSLFLGLLGNIMTALAPVTTAIAKTGGLLNVLKLGFGALTGPIGITIGIITLLTTGFVTLYSKSETFRNIISSLIEKIKELGSKALSILKVAIDAVVSFFKTQLATIQGFWKENSTVIIQALTNVYKFIKTIFENGILPVIKFVMPFILDLIKSVWKNIQGVIQGTLNVIMGAIKVFSGLLTGDFSKMWEGVKQIFSGAIQFVWNFVQLHFIGKILRGIGGFAKNLVSSLKGGWDKAIGGIKSFVGTAKSWFDDLLKSGKQKFDDLVTAAKELPGKIGSGIKKMAGKVTDGVKEVANKMSSMLGKGVNGVIGGINWVLDKIGIKELDPWTVPQYKDGTKGHPGGLAMVNDAPGQNYRELIQTPDGNTFMPQGRNVLMNLPKGTAVLPGNETSKLLNVPKYEGGVGDFFSMLLEGPKKLIKKVWDNFIPDLSVNGLVGDITKGSISFVKDKAFGYLKDKLTGFFDGGSVSPTGKGVSRWKNVILQAAAAMGEKITGAELNGILAQIQRESGGNEKIIQSSAVWDVNTAAGNPARGLLQYIPQTFNAYKVKGHKNIYSGYDQLLAFFNNKTWRRDLPYGRRGWGPRGGRKYATGGLVNEGLYHLGEEGWPEWIIPTAPNRRTEAMKLLALAGKEIQGNKRPNQLPSVSGNGGSNDNGYMKQLLEATLQQNKILMQLLQKDINVYLDSDQMNKKFNEINAIDASLNYF
ncbi:tape measure protein [Oceanobacillus caeni]